MKSSILRKLCAVSLSVLMVTGAGAAEVGSFITTSLPVAAATVATPSEYFRFSQLDDGTLKITFFKGGLEVVNLPSSIDYNGQYRKVTAIGDKVFAGKTSLKKLSIPDTVTSIGDKAFYGSSNLEIIGIPDNITHIGEKAFAGTKWLKNHTANVLYIGKVLYRGRNIASLTVKDGTTSISPYAMEDNSKLTSINLPSSLNEIGFCSFKGCTALTKITLPEGVTSIFASTFRGCKKLDSVNAPNVAYVGYKAFYNCTALKTFSSNTVNTVDESSFELCRSLTGFPSSKLESIGKRAFVACSSLKEFTIPSTTTSIGDQAFRNCTGLEKINYSGKIDTLKFQTFYGCTNLKSFYISSPLTVIEKEAFYDCTSLTKFVACSSLTTIGESAFSGCTGLNTLSLKNGKLKEIRHGAFWRCTSLTNVTVPDSVTTLGQSVFGDCTALKTAVVGEKTKNVGFRTFIDCTALESLTLKQGVKKFDWGAITGCNALKKIVIPDSVANIIMAESYEDRFIYYDNPSEFKGTLFITRNTAAEQFAGEYGIDVEYMFSNQSTITGGAIGSDGVRYAMLKYGKTAAQKITVNCNSADGQGNVKYTVKYKKPGASTWTAAAVGADNKAAITPDTLGKYVVRVVATDSTGKALAKDFYFTGYNKLVNTSHLGSKGLVTVSWTGGAGSISAEVSTQQRYSSNSITQYSGPVSQNTTVKVPNLPNLSIYVRLTDQVGNSENEYFCIA